MHCMYAEKDGLKWKIPTSQIVVLINTVYKGISSYYHVYFIYSGIYRCKLRYSNPNSCLIEELTYGYPQIFTFHFFIYIFLYRIVDMVFLHRIFT